MLNSSEKDLKKINNINQLLMLFFMGLIISGSVKAQINISSYFDFGANNSSDGLFIKSAALGQYQRKKLRVSGAFQLDFKSRNANTFSGFNIMAGREFTYKTFQFTVQGLFLYNRFSDLVHGTNWAIVEKTETKHMRFRLGTLFRTYALTKKAIDEYEIEQNEKIHENWNLIYLVQYNFKPIGNDWNVGVTLTNFDHFIISQETNPWFNVQGEYKLSAPVSLFAEAWLKRSGMFNISASHFGYSFRTGVVWRLGSEK